MAGRWLGPRIRALFFVFATGALAPAWADSIDDGIALLARGRPEAALKAFAGELVKKPLRAEAAYFAGVAYNRLGRSGAALGLLQVAETLRYRDPQLSFELGWAMLRQGRFAQARSYLEAYESLRPGQGQTSEFLGRVFIGLKQPFVARRHFAQAIKRDPKLAATVNLALAQLESSSGRPEAARGHIEQFRMNLAKDAAYRQADKGPSAGTRERKWRLDLSASGGRNTNVLAIGEGVPLPTDITNRAAGVATFTGAYAYDLIRKKDRGLTAGYYGRTDFYSDALSRADLWQNYLYLQWQKRLDPRTSLGLTLADDYTLIDGAALRNAITFGPTLRRRVTDRLDLELAYRATVSDYRAATLPVSSRDGVQHGLNLTAYVKHLSGARTYFGAGVLVDVTDGTDFDSHGTSLSVGHTVELSRRTTADLSATRVYVDYDNPASFTGFTMARSDEADYLSLRLTQALDKHLKVQLRHGLTRSGSNLRFFDYDQNVTTLGASYSF